MKFYLYKDYQKEHIGMINFNDMTISLLKALCALGYKVILLPNGDTSEPQT